MANDKSWLKIFRDYSIKDHNFKKEPFTLSAKQIKISCQKFKNTVEKEVRILCKQDTRESRPKVFKENNLFILPVKNGLYNIIQGEGYFDIPQIKKEIGIYPSKLKFHLDSSEVGDSEMQHLDFAYASSLIRTFLEDPTLVLTIRGRKYTPEFEFNVEKQSINVESVQTEVDAGYEGEKQIALVEAKKPGTNNTIIRQLYYPFRQWQSCTNKKVTTLFFERDINENSYSIWQFKFEHMNNYNSIKLVKSGKYRIK